MFRKHVDTENIKKSIGEIPAGALLHLTEKIHGTSSRSALVLETIPVTTNKVKAFLLKLLKQPLEKKEWQVLVGSRNVLLGHIDDSRFESSEGFRYKAAKDIPYRKGEVVYGELVGWSGPNKTIMGKQDTTKLKDKDLLKRFGPEMVYSYGAVPGECKLFVYRITQVNEDGYVTELSWFEVQRRAKELGLETVPHIASYMYYGNAEALLETLEGMVNKMPYPTSLLDSKHISEGVVIRAESEHGTSWFKFKGHTFLMLEGIEKENVDSVDLEEIS